MNKYEWLPTETAPKNYPVYLYQGYFTTTKDDIIRIPDSRTVYYGWGNTGSIHISGEDLKSVPESLYLSWFSYTENKYYKLQEQLPSGIIENLFQKELLNSHSQNKEHFNYIGVGIAPGGMVSVWMIGTGYQKEIGNYYAELTEIDFKDMIPTTEMTQEEYTEMILKEEVEDAILKEIKAGEIPFERWQDYRKKYDWKLALTHQEEFVPEHARISMLNGEQDVQYFDGKTKPLLETWAVPSSTRVQWRDSDGNLFAAQIEFEEQETVAAFEAMGKTDQKIVLTARIAKYNDSIKIEVSNAEEAIELQNTKVKIYSKTK